MIKKGSALSVVAAVAALVAAPAFAGVVQKTFTVVQPSVAANAAGTFQLPQFDPALGTLMQVGLGWEVSARVNAQIEHSTGTVGGAYVDNADLQFTFNAPQVAITALNEPIFQFSWLQNTPSPLVIAPSAPAIVANGQVVNSANWAPYIDDGFGPDTFDVQWAIDAYNGSGGEVWVGDTTFISGRVDQRLGGYNFSVTYTYDAPAVPEPASLALVGLGLLGLIGARRAKKA